MPHRVSIDSLDNDLLEKTFARIDVLPRIKVLPLVCRRFYAVLQRPGDCWRCVGFTAPRGLAAVGGVADGQRQRLLRFLSWALPRAPGIHDLRIDFFLHFFNTDDQEIAWQSSTRELLGAAAGSLRHLELRAHGDLALGAVLPRAAQARMTALTELQLLSGESMSGIHLAGLTALQRLNVVLDSAYPDAFAESAGPPSSLPTSLTWLGLNPAPLDAGADYSNRIPECVLALPGLLFLDVSESTNLGGLDAALPQLTTLTGLALDHTCLDQLPAELSLLRRLRLLSLHGCLDPEAFQPADYSPLGPLSELHVLSLSECSCLPALPGEVAGLTQLKALHLEKSNLDALPDGLHLPHLLMLSIDWRVLFTSHHVLSRLPRLQQLMLGNMYWPEEEAGEVLGAAPATAAAAVAQSLQRCPALRSVTLLMYPAAAISLGTAELMLRLPRSCPRLQLQALDAASFFLTDSEQMAAVGEGGG